MNMNTRKVAEEYRLTHWAGIMRQRTESGMSIKDFCKSAGFHENIYYYWQRKLREAACQQLLIAAQSGKPEITAVPNGWAVCDVVETETEDKTESNVTGQSKKLLGHNQSAAQPETKSGLALLGAKDSAEVSIEIGKSRITVNADIDAEQLTKVCRVLISLC